MANQSSTADALLWARATSRLTHDPPSPRRGFLSREDTRADRA